MSEIIATLFTADSRALEVIARAEEIELACLNDFGRLIRLLFTPSDCAMLETALRHARLVVQPEERTE